MLLISSTGTPPIVIRPSDVSQKRGSSRASVLLPDPDGPTTRGDGAGFKGKVDAADRLVLAVVREAHVLELDAGADGYAGLLRLGQRRCVEHVGDPIGGAMGEHQIVLGEGQRQEGGGQARSEDDEGQQVDCLNRSAGGHAQADRQDDDHGEDRRHHHVAGGDPGNLNP